MSDRPIIGIDLGTTYCCVGYYRTKDNTVQIMKNDPGDRTTPSYVYFSETGTIIGKFAKEQLHFARRNVVYDSKRLIGQSFDSKNVQKNLKNWSFFVIPGVNNKAMIKVATKDGSKHYEPEQISAKLLEHMKCIAQKRLGNGVIVENAVITVPAYFNYHQRTATERAGCLAGLNVLRIINEPTAAALAYVHCNDINGTENLLIFDLGGGTFDVSIVTAKADRSITVRATSGNTYLGGRDFDENLTNFISTRLETKYNVSIKNDEDTMRRIRVKSEKTKIDLSQTTEVLYDIAGLIPLQTDFDFEITRTDFERINNRLFQECLDIVNDCLTDAGMKPLNIHRVVLCGGSSRIPKLQQMLTKLFGAEKLSESVDPDEAVAYGAALQAGSLNENDRKAVMSKTTDITPLSLGIETLGGEMSFIVKRNSPIPAAETKTFSTVYNKQTGLRFDIFEGERPLVEHNTKIGSCQITNLRPRPPGYGVQVSFHVNDNGILEVQAKSDDGIYTSLAIEYETQDVEAIGDVLRKAHLNKTKDNATADVISEWNILYAYSSRIETVCEYDDRMRSEERDTVCSIAKDTVTWLDENKVKNGSTDEQRAILRKQKNLEDICHPILNKYSYNIQSMSVEEFYDFIIIMQNNV